LIKEIGIRKGFFEITINDKRRREAMKKERKDFLSRRDFLRISGLSAGAFALGSLGHLPVSHAKDVYPADKISYILPNKPGGGYDILARAISPYITKYLKEIPGAKGGDIMIKNEARKGYSLIYNSKPDGYTLGGMDTTPIIDNLVGENEIDYTKLTFLVLAVSTTKMVASYKTGFNSWKEVVEAMKKGPVKMGVGFFARANHIAGIIMNERMKTNFRLIPFPGTAECTNALMRGDVQVMIASQDSTKGLLDAKEIKPLLTFDEVTDYPGAVSLKDVGFPDLIDKISSHRFIVAPPNLEAEPKNALLTAIKKAITDKDFVAWAKNAEFPLTNLYGNDSEKFFLSFMKFYEELAPVFKKILK
jgi:tripartite-type tricarboxylate transporter receptor subunit TctC